MQDGRWRKNGKKNIRQSEVLAKIMQEIEGNGRESNLGRGSEKALLS